MARADHCLREKVDGVTAIEPDIAAAATFLVNYACAEEVAGATRYLHSQAYVRIFNLVGKTASAATKPGTPPPAGVTPAMLVEKMSVDPETGDIVIPPGSAGPATDTLKDLVTQLGSIMSEFMPETTPPALRKLAGDLVLKARDRRKQH